MGERWSRNRGSTSSILAEQSWGYLKLGQHQKTLAMRKELLKETQLGQNARVYAWIPLDWARAYRMIGVIEQCVAEVRAFYEYGTIMQSLHALRKWTSPLHSLEEDGYGDIPAVRDLREQIKSI